MLIATRGMGVTGSQEIGVIGGTLGSTVATLASSSAVLSALGIGAAAGPIGIAVGALVAAGAAIASALGVGNGCGDTCIAATQVVNQAEPIVKANLDAYENGVIDQQTAVSNFQQAWAAVEQACGKIPGAAGSNCTGDRDAGSCKWKATSQPYPTTPAVGECWNWFNGYYDPLTKPPMKQFVSVGGELSNTVNSFASSVGLSGSTLILVAGVALIGFAMVEN